jgi:hypothetical protein
MKQIVNKIILKLNNNFERLKEKYLQRITLILVEKMKEKIK